MVDDGLRVVCCTTSDSARRRRTATLRTLKARPMLGPGTFLPPKLNMVARRPTGQPMAASEHPADEELIARIASGDREAFGALYRRRRPDVYRFALLVCGSTAVADDVTQDVFMAVIHHARRYRPERSAVVPWLFGITRNYVRRSLHRQRLAVSLPDAESTEPGKLAVEPDPLAGLARQQHVAALRRAMLELPVKFREAIVLCDLQELSYADAAVALGCAIGTVRSRLHRGRALLAGRLRGTAEAPFQTPVARWIL